MEADLLTSPADSCSSLLACVSCCSLVLMQAVFAAEAQYCRPGADRAALRLYRLPKKQKLYDVEKELGRETRSVFPNQPGEPSAAEATKALLGTSNRFVSEAQVSLLCMPAMHPVLGLKMNARLFWAQPQLPGLSSSFVNG